MLQQRRFGYILSLASISSCTSLGAWCIMWNASGFSGTGLDSNNSFLRTFREPGSSGGIIRSKPAVDLSDTDNDGRWLYLLHSSDHHHQSTMPYPLDPRFVWFPVLSSISTDRLSLISVYLGGVDVSLFQIQGNPCRRNRIHCTKVVIIYTEATILINSISRFHHHQYTNHHTTEPNFKEVRPKGNKVVATIVYPLYWITTTSGYLTWFFTLSSIACHHYPWVIGVSRWWWKTVMMQRDHAIVMMVMSTCTACSSCLAKHTFWFSCPLSSGTKLSNGPKASLYSIPLLDKYCFWSVEVNGGDWRMTCLGFGGETPFSTESFVGWFWVIVSWAFFESHKFCSNVKGCDATRSSQRILSTMDLASLAASGANLLMILWTFFARSGPELVLRMYPRQEIKH